jgi:hypothetical protein
MTFLEEVQQVKTANVEGLLARPNVVGVGAGLKVAGGQLTDQVSIVTLVTQKQPTAALSPEGAVPPQIDGVPTDVFEVGVLEAQSIASAQFPAVTVPERLLRVRPAMPGVSLGHPRVTSGTFGCVVYDRKTGERLVLSNNHILADCNRGVPGDPILQPGPANGGRADQDVLASLLRYYPLWFDGCPRPGSHDSLVQRAMIALARMLKSQRWLDQLAPPQIPANSIDAAVARPLVDADILDEIIGIGKPGGVGQASLGLPVRKSGRATGLNSGRITVMDTTVMVSYPEGRSARFDHQILTTPMSLRGDSGSLLVARDSQEAIGLLIGGSAQVTIYCPIQTVFESLEVSL